MSYTKVNLGLYLNAAEKISNSGVFEVDDINSDCSTISASEVNSYECYSPTPPLFCKLRKARIKIKKLPRHVLEKYNLISKKSSKSSFTQPSRTSSRNKGKNVPGHYLSLHENKPIEEIVNKKRKIPKKHLTTERSVKHNSYINKKPIRYVHKSNDGKKTTFIPFEQCEKSKNIIEQHVSQKNRFFTDNTSSYKQSLHDRIAATSFVHVNKDAEPTFPNLFDKTASYSRTRLYPATAGQLCNKNVQKSTYNFPDVVITKYDLPTNKISQLHKSSGTTSLTNPTSSLSYDGRYAPQFNPTDNNKTNTRFNTNFQHNITQQVPKLYNTSVPYSSNIQNSQPSSTAFPTSIMPATLFSNFYQNKVVNPTAVIQNKSFQKYRNYKQKTTEVQTNATAPPNILPQNDPVIVDSSKVLIINQPSLRSDPLDMPGSSTKPTKLPQRQQVDVENNADITIDCSESDSELNLTDGTEPFVIKRIIYHTKSVQTKFTCNGSICGLVDSEEFNLNCFYCYDIFPLHKWLEFKEHIKQKHHVEEKENLLDSDENMENRTKSKELLSESITKQPILLNEKNSSNQLYKKLPPEPRLFSRRFKKINTFTSTPKNLTCQNTDHLNQSSKGVLSSATIHKSFNDDTISLDNNECDIDLERIDDDLNETKVNDVNEFKKTTSNNLNLKANNVSQEKFTNTTNLLSRKEPLNKLPANCNLQTGEKTIKKFTENGRTRYFVVKNILKSPKKDAITNKKISNMIGTKNSEAESSNESNVKVKTNNDDVDMLSNDENEDSIPKPTNGCGILFGVTNSMIVIAFLLKLKTFPELWRPQLRNTSSINYNESIRKLCNHVNNRFDLNIQDLEMRLSIQRVKDWYCHILKNIYEYNQNINNTEPYKHKFPVYFKILNQFLTPDVNYSNNLLLSSRFSSDTNISTYPECMVYKTGTPPSKSKNNAIRSEENVVRFEQIKPKKQTINLNVSKPLTPTTNLGAPEPLIPTIALKAPEPLTPSLSMACKPDDSPLTKEMPTTAEMSTESLIEFDADTLYENESSDEEVLEEFDETKNLNIKFDQIEHQPKKRRTKVYLGKFDCDICNKSYKRRCDLARHRTLHFPPEFECSVCCKKYYFRHSAERCTHIKLKKSKEDKTEDNTKGKRVWPKKIFKFKLICEICGASYRSIGSLITHRKDKHLNQRQKCVVCNFTALSNWRIVQHQKKRHIVEPGTVEEVAKKSRPRMDTKTRFSVEARQEFDWRREMRKKLKPGEKFYACCKCRIIFNSRKEKVLHNKLEHPIKDTTVICLLCLPTKLLLANSNCARRHYTDIHKVPWDEIDALVKRTKPIFNILSKEEIEHLNASENYKQLLEELLKDRKLEPIEKVENLKDETVKAEQNIPHLRNIKDEDVTKIDVESTKEEDVFVDGIIEHDYNNEVVYDENVQEFVAYNEHDYSDEPVINNENYDNHEAVNDQMRSFHEKDVHSSYDIDANNKTKMLYQNENAAELLQNTVDELVDEEFVEECIVVEECLSEVMGEGEYF